MVALFRDLDEILRGKRTDLSALKNGTINISTGGLIVTLIILGVLYGVCMGCYALLREDGPHYTQFVATAVKVPLLFLATLVVTFPSLYVFNALVGSRLTLESVLKLLIAALAVMLAVLASFGPITAFFSLSTSSYPFMKLLNVILFAVAGFLGLSFLLQTLHRLTVSQEPLPFLPPETQPAAQPAPDASALPPGNGGALDPLEDRVPARNVMVVFRCWVIVFGLVGAQMAWVMRPFLGHPDLEFRWFRTGRESNFFESVLIAIQNLLN